VEEEALFLIFNPAEVQIEGSIGAERHIYVLPTLECDGSEDQALLSRTS